eukprot:765706-Hanusia_phi.AAC.1
MHEHVEVRGEPGLLLLRMLAMHQRHRHQPHLLARVSSAPITPPQRPHEVSALGGRREKTLHAWLTSTVPPLHLVVTSEHDRDEN